MATLRCPTCGYENPPTNSFCAKCATSLSRESARANRKSHVFLPPQTELAKKTSTKSASSFPTLALALIVIVIAGIAIYLWS